MESKRPGRAQAVIASGIGLAAICAASVSGAQQVVEKVERVEVTGSRLISSDVESASPIAIVTAQDIAVDGSSALEHVINNLPQFNGEQSNRVSNGASGTATADLRGLGPARTLVLVNGRRLPMGSTRDVLAADLNQIPAPLVSRIEVLTGGASAVHGSDAIAGVVNFILDTRFEGVRGEIKHDFHAHRQKSPYAELVRARGFSVPGDTWHDGQTTSASLTLGRKIAAGRGHATAFFRYLESEELPQSERDYSACALTVGAGGDLLCGGSNASYPGLFRDLDRSGRRWTIADAAGALRPFNPATDSYNFAPFNYYQRPQKRYSFNGSAGFDLSDGARLYAEFGYHDDRTLAQVAPSGIFGQIVRVRYDNPLLTEHWRSSLVFRRSDGTIGTGPGTSASVFIARRNVEGGPRQETLRHESYRQVLGIRGDSAEWEYDLFAQIARVSFDEKFLHTFSITRTQRALDVVVDPATGRPACAAAVSGADRACVPWNIWRLGAVTPEAVGYLEVPASQQGFTSLRALGGSVSRELGQYGVRFPGAPRGVEAVIGFERRIEELSFEPDEGHTSGDLAGLLLATPALRASSAVSEAFAELRAPLRAGLDLGGSYRRSAYGSGQKTDTFGLGFNAALRPARVRGSYQHAIRAANLRELFDPRVEGPYFLAGGDPCSGTAPARSFADCARTGVTQAQYGTIADAPLSPSRFPALVGGDPRVEPETAKTATVGVAFTPLRQLSATLDYFDIRLQETIGAVAPDVTLAQCLNTGASRFCERIHRDPVYGTLWLGGAYVDATNQNVGRTRVAGFDAALDMRHRSTTGHGIAAQFIGTYLRRWDLESFAGAGAIECAGLFAGRCGAPKPRWRHRLRLTWQTPWHLDIAATWRYVRATTEDFPDPVTAPAATYLDLALEWRLDQRVSLRAGMSNVADRDPPVIPAGGIGVFNGNTAVGIYEPLGRRVFLALTAKL